MTVFDKKTWRPYIHLEDLSYIVNFFVKKKFKFKPYVFNTGINGANYTKEDICNEILKQLPSRSKFISYIEKSSFDKRNYKVDFSKIEKFLNNKKTKNVNDGFKEILEALKNKNIEDKDFYNANLDALVKFFKQNRKKLEGNFIYD